MRYENFLSHTSYFIPHISEMSLNINSPLFKFLDKLIDVFFLNLLMLVCCIPIVTIGTSVTAAFAVVMKMVDDEEGYIYKTFFKEFKSNFKKGTILWLMLVVAIYALYIEWQVVTKMDNVNFIFVAIAIVSTAIVVVAFLYVFPLTARYENTIFKTIKNSFDISVYFFGRTFFILAICAIEVCIFIWNRWMILAGILVGPMILIYTIAGIGKKIFLEIEQDFPVPKAESDSTDS